MKIVCQNCGKTYKIADEKVQGKKVFKIKCKNCNEDILVRGDQAGEAHVEHHPQHPVDDDATRAMAAENNPIDGGWHVVVNGEQQGPFGVDQLRDMMGAGQIDSESYVWREGYEGWQPMHSVPDLNAVFEPVGGAIGESTVAAPMAAYGGGDLFASLGSASESPAAPAAGSDLFGAPPATAQRIEVAPATAKKRATTKQGGSDLFAAEARAQEASRPLFTGDDQAAAAAPSGGAIGGNATGQRNENSVLFSLATLQQLSGGPEKPAAPVNFAPGGGDSSGLIDINKLAGALGKDSPGAGASRRTNVDDILSVGTSGGLNTPLAAPVLAPLPMPMVQQPVMTANVAPPSGANKTVVVTGVAVALILGLAGIGAVVLSKRGDTTSPTVASNTPPPPATNPGAGPGVVPENVPTAGGPAVPAAPSATPEAPPPNTPPVVGNPSGDGRPRNRDRERPGRRDPTTNTGSAPSAPVGRNPLAAPPAPGPSGPTPARRSGPSSIEDLMGQVGAPGANRAPATAPSAPSGGGDLPESPSRGDVMAGLRAVSGAVRSCGQGGGTASVTVTFNSSGRVNTATVAAPIGGTSVGSCVISAVRGAHVPPFSRPTFQVTFPFGLN